MSKNKYLFPLIVMASLFFLFGFITTMNNSMIDFLKDAFDLQSNRLKQLPNSFSTELMLYQSLLVSSSTASDIKMVFYQAWLW
jgi:hypothetical protein